MIIGGLLGGVLGILAAYYRRLDGWIMRLVDIMLAFPAILIGLAVAAIFGAGLTAVVIALVVATVPDVARVARGAAIGVMGQEFMEAGRAVGVSDRALIWRYLTLNCISTIFVFLTLRFGQIILIGSALSFLGMGAQPPTAELGMMAAQGRDFLFMAPHIAIIPSLVRSSSSCWPPTFSATRSATCSIRGCSNRTPSLSAATNQNAQREEESR